MPSMLEAAQIRDVAQRHAYVFDNGLSSPDFFDVEKRMASEEFALLREHVMPEWDVLEVGCFTGLNLLGLAKSGHTGLLDGVEFVAGAVRWFMRKADRWPNLRAFQAKFPPSQPLAIYDAVVAFDVLEHQQNVGQFLDKVSKLPRIINVGAMELTTVSPARPGVTVKVTCTAMTFVLNDQPAPAAAGKPGAPAAPAGAPAKKTE